MKEKKKEENQEAIKKQGERRKNQKETKLKETEENMLDSKTTPDSK